MKIELEIRQEDLDSTIHQLHDQMTYYGTNTYDGGVLCMIGDRFNVYIYPHQQALLPKTVRKIAIEPKDTPM
ncbi:MAG: hypothetical protein ACW99G_05100 [Candidatus Thorarchaeota archaeon]|jgi:hypothetical protein